MLLLLDVSDCQSGSEDDAQEGGATVGNSAAVGSEPHENILAALQDKLKELMTAYELVVKNSHQLLKFASELELESGGSAGKPKEKVALFKITSSAVVKVREGMDVWVWVVTHGHV